MKTREELLAEVRALRAFREGGRAGQRAPADASLADTRRRAIVEDQRLVWRCRPDGMLTFVNDACCRYIGRDRATLIGGSSMAFVAEAYCAEVREHLGALGPGNPSAILEHELLAADGETRWVRRADQVLLGAGGEVAGVETVARDVTEERRARAALSRGEAVLRAFFECTAEAIVGVDQGGRIVLANPRADVMFGHDQGQLVGQPLEILIPERIQGVHGKHQADYFRVPRNRAMGLGSPLTGRRRDGSEFPIDVSLTYVPGQPGDVAVAFVTDISDRIAHERQTRHVEKLAALGTLAAGIAHELNNPIGILQSRIELMLMDLDGQADPADWRADLRVLHRHTQRLGRIAQGLLSFGRERQQDRRPIDLNEVVEDTLLLAGKQLNREGIHIVTVLHERLPRMVGDATALEQVLMNLLLNARDAMPAGGTVRIETAPGPSPTDTVRLVFSDTGEGMSPEVLAGVAQPFFTSKPNGTGLGLSVSYTIIRDHAGAVEVQSEPGRGTSFSITFPCVSNQPSP